MEMRLKVEIDGNMMKIYRNMDEEMRKSDGNE